MKMYGVHTESFSSYDLMSSGEFSLKLQCSKMWAEIIALSIACLLKQSIA